VAALAPESAGHDEVGGRRGGVAVGQPLDRVQPVVSGDGDEEAEERDAGAEGRRDRQRSVRRDTTHDQVVDDVRVH